MLADRIAAVLAEHRETHISGLCSCGKSYPDEHVAHQAERIAQHFEQVGTCSTLGVFRYRDRDDVGVPVWRWT